MINRPVNEGTRIAAMVLDHLIMTIIAMLFYIPMLINTMATAFAATRDATIADFNYGGWLYVGLFGFSLYFCKDSIHGRSIAKRILRLQVVDNKTGEAASPLQCFVRNLFCIIWFVEFFVALANTGRRIGDRVAGTRLVYYDPAASQPKWHIFKLLASLVMAYGFVLLFTLPLQDLKMPGPKYSAASYNHTASKELEQLITDSLGAYLIPHIRIYDSTATPGRKYVTANMQLRENYIEDDDSYRQLREMTTGVIYSRLPEETFSGQLQFVYRGKGKWQARQSSIGTFKTAKRSE